jgi:hypothetical protein
MANSIQTFPINNCNVTPNGNKAQMSRTGTNNQPNQGQWRNDDKQYDYTITLCPTVWLLPTGKPSFTITKGETSRVYQLLETAPLGASSYTLVRSDGTTCKEKGLPKDPQDPDVIINS